ncbi:CCCH-type Zn-finger protein [Vairimorpha necatrix]|uniref:CCCH-type Zn-finger protein n=1 Tax=Vairimorpha necatrix TaxID=6039 RepID=A0AAX4JCY7_9MICR
MKKGGNIFNLNSSDNNVSVYQDIKNIKPFLCDLKSSKEYFNNKKVQLYKTEICRSHSEIGYCKYGTKCQFAHALSELRSVNRHPRYKTETCKTFWEEGSCPYGKRCCFIHIKNNNIDIRVLEENTNDENIVENIQQEEIYKPDIEKINFKKMNEIESGMFSSIDRYEDKDETNKDLVVSKDVDRLPNLKAEIEIDVSRYDTYDNISDCEEAQLDISEIKSCSCKDFEIFNKDNTQNEWSDKFLELSKEDALFFESLFVREHKPFWESNKNFIWTNSPLFYNNNYKWK